MKTWIVVVNRCEAKIFASDRRGNNGEVHFIEKLENPRGRLKSGEIDADRPGFVASSSIHGGRLVKKQSPTDRVSEMFAKKVAERLEEGRQQNVFEELVLIAAPQFLGKVRRNFSRELRECIVKEIPKDLAQTATDFELKERIWPEEEARI
ncbi:host attachment protein [Bdellovibrio bacteriovorus]|uniref:host attachment protein n=1 Tax=Bdellovibrio bacteriovorus TaxID=959 RepID=UPI0021D0745D|nr:host attachment protein [Bdellovibrio bacteriovorus]UXR63998.1 host attachment protein [Bdellovibrio bacteriovorus]